MNWAKVCVWVYIWDLGLPGYFWCFFFEVQAPWDAHLNIRGLNLLGFMNDYLQSTYNSTSIYQILETSSYFEVYRVCDPKGVPLSLYSGLATSWCLLVSYTVEFLFYLEIERCSSEEIWLVSAVLPWPLGSIQLLSLLVSPSPLKGVSNGGFPDSWCQGKLRVSYSKLGLHLTLLWWPRTQSMAPLAEAGREQLEQCGTHINRVVDGSSCA